MHDAETAIVGYGPVGKTLAVLLAQLGRSVIVLERWPEPYSLPRAVHMDHQVARIFQSCGIGGELRAITEPAHVYEWRNAAGVTLLRFGRLGDSASGWPESLMFSQPVLESILHERARSLPRVTVCRGFEAVGIDQDDAGVVIRGADGTEVQAQYVVGCDGANSAVRRLAGLTARDLGFFFDWLIVDVVLDRPRVFDPINVQICDPARPTTVVSGGPGRRRWEFMRLPGESVEELNDETRAWELLAPWDVHRGNARLERHALYTFSARYAERWRNGRILIAGDAAHLMPPFAGQGMCAGIRDAANLAWKLDFVLAGLADESLLDTYEQERKPSAQAAIEFSVELGKIICLADPAEAAARDEAMAGTVAPEPVEVPPLPSIDAGLIHASAPNAGAPFVQGTVGGRPFDDAEGAGWRLVTLDLDIAAVDGQAVAWFTSIGGRVVKLASPDPVYARWFADHQAAAALQRPDFHLYGSATTPDDTVALLADLRRQLESPPGKEQADEDR